METLREVGRPIPRVDAYDKVTGRAKFTDDLCPKPCLEAKLLHSTIANGRVISIDTTEALKVPGVVAIYTCFDVPEHPYPVAGHPWYANSAAAKRDQADRRLLDRRVRIYGDNIAVVVGEDTVACDRALRLIKVEYEEYPVVYDAIESMKGTEVPVHEAKPDNIVAHTCALRPATRRWRRPSRIPPFITSPSMRRAASSLRSTSSPASPTATWRATRSSV